jgi:cytochrome c oxidase subunit 4
MAHQQETHQSHASRRTYLTIGIILGVVTVVEWLVFYIDATPALLVAVFLLLSFAKFMLVVGYFMHLKFDDKRFAALFFFPFVTMLSIAVVLLAVFENLTR